MPSGQTHDRITLWSLPWLTGTVFCLTDSAELTLIVSGAFLFSGLMFGPDLDIYSLQYKRWGILSPLWLPYRKLLRHRSFFSHGLVIGTVIRLIYLLIFGCAIAIFSVAILQLILGFDWNWQQVVKQGIQLIYREYSTQAIAVFIGLELGAMSHSLSDWLNSSLKNRQRLSSRWRNPLMFQRQKSRSKRNRTSSKKRL